MTAYLISRADQIGGSALILGVLLAWFGYSIAWGLRRMAAQRVEDDDR